MLWELICGSSQGLMPSNRTNSMPCCLILLMFFHLMTTLDHSSSSQEGIGAVLSQEIDGKEIVKAYASRALSKTERKYSVTRKELLAAVTFVHHFRSYLLRQCFLLRTDHSSLTWLQNFKEPEGQLARWIEKLQEFNFTVIH